jgi:hypothetical protein
MEAIDPVRSEWGVMSPFSITSGPIGPAGYAGFEIDPTAKVIYLYWKYGVEVPPSVVATIDMIRGSGRNLELERAPFSYEDLRDELRTLTLSLMEEGIPLSSIGPSRTSQGLTVVAPDAGRVVSSRSVKNAINRLRAKSKKPPENPIAVSEAPPPEHIRLADRSPYWGGARIANANNIGSCTSGFAVGNLFGKYLLTAGHCSTHTNGVFFRTGDGKTIGRTWGAQPSTPEVSTVSTLFSWSTY